MGEIFNLQELLASFEFSLEQDRAGLWTGSQVYHVAVERLAQALPRRGSPHPRFPFLSCEGVSVRGRPAGMVEITAQFAGGQGADPSGDNPEDPPADPGTAGEGDSSFERIPPPEYTLDQSFSEEPIELHPRFATLTDQQILIAADLARNPPMVDQVVEVTPPGGGAAVEETVQVPADLEPTIVLWPDLQVELYNRIRGGQTSYREPRATWTMRYVSNAPLPDLNKLGKIDEPRGPVPAVAAGRNWQRTGARQSLRGRVWEIELSWELSGRGGFDSDLYT